MKWTVGFIICSSILAGVVLYLAGSTWETINKGAAILSIIGVLIGLAAFFIALAAYFKK